MEENLREYLGRDELSRYDAFIRELTYIFMELEIYILF